MKTLAAGAGFDKAKFDAALIEYENGRLRIDNEAVNSKTHKARAAMGFLVQFMLYRSVITAGLVLEDKNSGIFYRVFYAPVTLKRYIAENLAAFLAVGIIQVTLVLVLIKSAFGIEFGGNGISMYLLFIVFSLVCISLGMYLVSLFKKPMGAYTTIVLITTPLVMLGSCYWPMDFMPRLFQKIALFLPTSWVMASVDKILYKGTNIIGVGLEISVLIIFTGIFLSAGLFKKVDISK